MSFATLISYLSYGHLLGMAKTKASFLIPEETLDAARDAVAFLSGPPLHLTLAELADAALRAEILRLQQEHHGGQPFPPRKSKIKTGRPVR
jgi:hypothetical protein